MKRILQKGHQLQFPFRTTPLDINQAYKKYIGRESDDILVNSRILGPEVAFSFELAYLLLIKAIRDQNQSTINQLCDQQTLGKCLDNQLQLISNNKDQYEIQSTLDNLSSSQNSNKLNPYLNMDSLLIYESLLAKVNKQNRGMSQADSSDFKRIYFFGNASVKRQIIMSKRESILSLFGKQRVLRAHCLIDTNLKLKISKTSQNLNGKSQENCYSLYGSNFNNDISEQVNQTETRIVTFECQNFKLKNSPMLIDSLTLEQNKDLIHQIYFNKQKNEEKIKNDQESSYTFKPEQYQNLNLDKAAKFLSSSSKSKINSKRKEFESSKQENLEDQKQFYLNNIYQRNEKLQGDQFDLINSQGWKIVDIDYWLGGNLPYL